MALLSCRSLSSTRPWLSTAVPGSMAMALSAESGWAPIAATLVPNCSSVEGALAMVAALRPSTPTRSAAVSL